MSMKNGCIHHNMKKTAGICLLALLFILLTGCGKISVFDGSRVTDETGFRMEYTVLDREETADLELSEGDQLQVTIAHQSGKVDVTVGRSGKETIYSGTGQENA